MGKPKPKLTLDISQINSAPPNESPRPAKPNGRSHTNYVDLVRQLRNPATAEPITKWMETGRVAGRPLGSPKPKWTPKPMPTTPVLPKPKTPILSKPKTPVLPKPKTPVQEHANYFDEDSSGSCIPFLKKSKSRVKKSPKFKFEESER